MPSQRRFSRYSYADASSGICSERVRTLIFATPTFSTQGETLNGCVSAHIAEYLGGCCTKCGSVEDLDFDHRDPTSKVKEISQAIIAAWSWDRLRVELDKCQLLCRPHHIEKGDHRRGGGHNRIEIPSMGHGRDTCEMVVNATSAENGAASTDSNKWMLGACL